MDPLSDILALVQPSTYATGGLSAGGDWGVRFPAHGMIKCYSVVQGECWLAVENVAEPVQLQTGAVCSSREVGLSVSPATFRTR